MRKIEYTYSTVARQFLFIAAFIFFLLYFAVITEILIFKIDKYYNVFNFPLTYGAYVIIFIAIACLFFQHRFFTLEYSKEVLIYKNRFLRKTSSVSFDDVGYILCDSSKAYFFNKTNVGRNKADAIFTLPYFRGGRIDVVAYNKMLEFAESKGIQVTKTYKIMPGYGSRSKFLSLLYGFLAICIIANCATPLYTVIVLFTSH